jgi:membrane associated rhomboid family serine protease
MTIRQTRRFLIFVIAMMIAASLLQVGVMIFHHGSKSSSLFIASPLLFTVIFAAQLRRLRDREAIEGPDAPFAPEGNSRKKSLILILGLVIAAAAALAAALLLRRHG